MTPSRELTAKIEPFDSFWEAPENIEKGYKSFYKFYKYNYLKHVPKDKNKKILVISCGPGYFVNLLTKGGYRDVLGIDSFPDKVRYAQERSLNCREANAIEYLEKSDEPYDVIFCEQELNHLTKQEILDFLNLCWQKLHKGGTLIVHALNGVTNRCSLPFNSGTVSMNPAMAATSSMVRALSSVTGSSSPVSEGKVANRSKLSIKCCSASWSGRSGSGGTG